MCPEKTVGGDADPPNRSEREAIPGVREFDHTFSGIRQRINWRAGVLAGGLLPIAIALLACLRPAAAAEKQVFAVSYVQLGTPLKEANAAEFKSFVARLNARPDFDAVSVLSAGKEAWLTAPAAIAPTQWLSLAEVNFGRRGDWLACVFDAAAGSLAFVARRPSLRYDTAGIYACSVPPGDRQFECNAVIELAADIGNAYRAAVGGTNPAAHPPVQINVRPGSANARKRDAADGLADLTAAAAAHSLSPPEMEGLRALAFAAGYAAGWRPTAQAAAAILDLTVAREVQAYTLDATLRTGNDQRRAVKKHAQEEYLYDYLLTLFRQLRFWGEAVADFALLEPGELELFTSAGDFLVTAREGGIQGFHAVTGDRKWDIAKPERVTPRYTARPGKDGRPRLFRYDSGLAEIALETGQSAPIPEIQRAAAFGWSIAAGDSGRYAVAVERDIVAGRKGQAAWTNSGAAAVTCGPLLDRDRIYAGREDGSMVCLAADTGAPIWETTIAGRLRGEIGATRNLIFAGTIEGTFYALAAGNGEVAWTNALGDCLAGPPRFVHDKLLVIGRHNVLRLLDPQTGKQAAERRWPTWMTAFAVAPDGREIVIADQNGTVAFLAGDDLKVTRSIDLQERLNAGMIVAAEFPQLWGAGEEFVERIPAILVCDRRGFVYLIPATDPKASL